MLFAPARRDFLRSCPAFLLYAFMPARSPAAVNQGVETGGPFIYKQALPGRTLSFPADHYAHPDFKIEWWYYTGHLETASRASYGFQVTFFRFGLRDRQKNDSGAPPLFTDLYMAHFALSDVNKKEFTFRERISRGMNGKAGAATDRYLVWNEDWRVEGDRDLHRISVADRGAELRLALESTKPPVLHGREGLSQKAEGEGRASYYYSLTRMRAEGELVVERGNERVRGLTWMDHEFGSNQLADDQVGWDWFSIQLSDRTELMLYVMRRKDGSVDPHSSGTYVTADGTSRHLRIGDFAIETLERWKSPRSGATYPAKWRAAVPGEHIDLVVTPVFPDQELITNRSTRVTYWEGAAGVSGTARRQPVLGDAYVELTGYAGKVNI